MAPLDWEERPTHCARLLLLMGLYQHAIPRLSFYIACRTRKPITEYTDIVPLSLYLSDQSLAYDWPNANPL